MSSFNKILALLGLVVFVAAVGVMGGGGLAGGTPLKIYGTDPRGGATVDLEEHRGKVVLVQFFATWCGPCMAEYPNIVRLHERYADRGFDVIMVSLDRSEGALTSFLAERQVPFPVIFEEGASLASRYNVRSIPKGFLVGRDGRVVVDGARGPALESALVKAL